MATDRPVALVTGGTRGIGKAIAAGLVADGLQVVACGRTAPVDPDPAIEFEACDVRQAGEVEMLIARIVERHGRLDVVVNNAGGSPEVEAASASPRFSEAIIALNLLAPIHVSRAANAVMQEQAAGGCIVNIASVSGVRPSPGTAAYGAAKAGLLSLTQSLAMEWGPKVRVNALVVGLVATEAAADHYGGAEGVARIAEMLPLKRMASGDDIAQVVRFLASPAAAYVSGAQIAVHGGGERPSFLELARR